MFKELKISHVSIKAIKERVEQCANCLSALSTETDSVLYVGHGGIIWLIHKQLLRKGWFGPKNVVRKHWEFGVYTQ